MPFDAAELFAVKLSSMLTERDPDHRKGRSDTTILDEQNILAWALREFVTAETATLRADLAAKADYAYRMDALAEERAAEIATLRAERDRLQREQEIYGSDIQLKRYRAEALERIAALGFKQGELITAYWNAEHPRFDDQTVYAVICEALTQEGIAAWPGDATGMIRNMLFAQAQRAERAEAERDRLQQDLMSAMTREDGEALSVRCATVEAENDRLRQQIAVIHERP